MSITIHPAEPQCWLWPDRTIRKAESGHLREEHNHAVNEWDRLLAQRDALAYELGGIHDALEAGGTVTIEPGSVKAEHIRAALAALEGGGA